MNFYHKLLSSANPMLTLSKLNSQMDQSKRLKVFSEFSSAKKGVLIATDVVARGIDFSCVENIIQIDPP